MWKVYISLEQASCYTINSQVIALLSADNLSRDEAFKRQEYAVSVSLYLGANKADKIRVCKFSFGLERENVL